MRALFLLCFLFSSFLAAAEGRPLPVPPSTCPLGDKVPFVDEAPRKPAFAKWRRQFLENIERKDVAALSAVLSPSVQFSFGADGEGPAAFLSFHKLKGPEAASSELWGDLAIALRRGGHWEGGEFRFPYVAKTWPSSCDDFGGYAAVFGRDVPLRKSAAPDAPSVSTLSEELVRVVEGSGAWVKVEAVGGKSGFIDGKTLVNPIGNRGAVRLVGSRWTVTTFISGE